MLKYTVDGLHITKLNRTCTFTGTNTRNSNLVRSISSHDTELATWRLMVDRDFGWTELNPGSGGIIVMQHIGLGRYQLLFADITTFV